jgi:hypothetical protein
MVVFTSERLGKEVGEIVGRRDLFENDSLGFD